MIDFNKIVDGSIVICPSSIKKELIKNKSVLNIIKDIKFMSKEELIKGFYFSYDINAIYYLHEKYGYEYSLCEEVIKNLYNISPINDKLKLLNNIYEDLCNNKLLITTPYFKYLFNNKKVYILGYSKRDIELLDIISKITSDFEYSVVEFSANKKLECFKFNDIEEEVIYVMARIGELVESGVSLNNIYFYSIPSEYKLILKKYFIFNNLILSTKSDLYIYDTPIFKEYLELLKDNSFVDAYSMLIQNIKYDPQDVLGAIVDLVVEVTSLKIEKEKQIEVLCYLASKKTLQNLEYKESIKEIDDSYILEDYEYCFMLGFSQSVYPVIVKDTEFYLDSEKVLLNRNTSIVKNEINEEKLIRFISNTKNLIITFKNKVDKTVYYPSVLIEKLGIVMEKKELNSIRYSKVFAEFEVSKYLDLNKLYGVDNKWINTFTIEELGFNIYDHNYKKIVSFDKNQQIELSYTQIDDFMKCPFKYYLKHILRVDEFIGSFKTEIGTLFHNILEESNTKEINLDDYKEVIYNTFKTYKDRYFAEKVLPQVLKVVKKVKEFHNSTILDNISYEKELRMKIDELSTLMGRIDKFLIDDASKLIAVVDYKTGKFEFDKDKVEFGLSLQLPIYALLLSEEYPDYLIAGVYIQKILQEKENLKDIESYLMDGITINDLNIIKLIDPTLGNLEDEFGKKVPISQYIKGIKVKNDGALYKGVPVVDSSEFSCILQTTRKHVEYVINQIRNASFEISPLDVVEEKGDACTYCKFSDICNHDYKDKRRVSIKKGDE